MKLTLMTKVLLAAVGAFALYILATVFNLVPSRFVQQSAVPVAVELPTERQQAAAPAGPVTTTLPSTKPAAQTGPPMRMKVIPWNAETGIIFANGGTITTTGSLMEKHGARLNIERQNDQNITQQEQAKFASALAKDSNPTDGTHFAIIMGDGAAQYVAGLNSLTSKLGPEYQAEVIGAVGFSGNDVSGEDAFMGPEEWKSDPQSMKGGVVAGVLRDGDWNIALYYLQQWKIKNNPDERTWDPDALNWVSVDDFTKAGELYIANHCEERDIVRDGKRTGEKKKDVCVQAAVTWTPGDVIIAKKKGGLVKILSTKENANQMPATIIGIKKWDEANAKKVENMLAGAFEGADAVRASPEALKRASQAMYAVMKEESPAYWLKYYNGVIESDKKGLPIPLGGSRVANLGDNLNFFGVAEGTGGVASSKFNSTYDGFGRIAKQQYPKLIPNYPPTKSVVNTRYIESLARTMSTAPTETPTFSEGKIEKENVVAKRDWNILFDTGKATFTPAAQATLDDLYNQLTVGNLSVQIDGHTDNVGDSRKNQSLSEDRAFAVKKWLEAKAPTLFPKGRLNARGYGDSSPTKPNSTPEGRAENRRVTITIGTK